MNLQTPMVKNLHVYPIKSAAGISLSNVWLDELGLSFDRRFVLSDVNGQFITARTQATLCLIQVHLLPHGLMLSAPNMESLAIEYSAFGDNYQNVSVWGTDIQAQHCLAQYDDWFSRYLNIRCKLLFFGDKSQRQVKNSKKSVAFADAYPLLIISQASLDDLNKRSGEQLTMSRFRPNIVVDNCQAFEEDTWKNIRIGDVEFELINACSRCNFTTLNPENAEKHPLGEPLTTLKSYRQDENGDMMFGQNLVALNQGRIQQGDSIEILSNKAPLSFITPKLVSTQQQPNNSEVIQKNEQPVKQTKNMPVTIAFTSWDKSTQGNTEQTLLEQGEAAGLFMPYSCREGMCGACKVQLDSGEVHHQSTEGLSELEQQAGFILSCSCVPQSDVAISKIDRTKLRALKEQERQAHLERKALLNNS